MQDTMYQVEFLQQDKYKLFKGLYTDFIAHAISDYHFELQPLTYEEFIDAVSKGLLHCAVLLENLIPTAFLVYSTAISESVELNVIHCLGDEDLVNKRNKLMEFFMEQTKEARKNSVVCYPMLGSQGEYTPDITHFGFKLIGLIVLRFLMNDSLSSMILENMETPEMDSRYQLVQWNSKYLESAVNVVHSTFQHTSDALFDTRFTTLDGTRDIIDKVVNSIYGEFLPEATTVLLCDGEPVGFAFANVTGGKIANIPLVGVLEQHRGTGLSVLMLQRVMNSILNSMKAGKRQFSEVNVTTETDNFGALRMYRTVGFREDYSYSQAYLPAEM